MIKRTINWGILGPGVIARKFAEGLKAVPDARITAVGSRDIDRAQAFAVEFQVPNAYGSYQALASDPEVDVVYIATPHSRHKEHTLLCTEACKHVLCEKPFAINAAEAGEMVASARVKGVFLMEAMWSRYLPTLVKTRELLGDGMIGQVRMLQADFGFRTMLDPEGRLFNPTLGGGALLDVGIYTLSLAHMVLGAPTQIQALAHKGETGVDEQTGILLGYDHGQLALLSTAIRTNTPHEAFILGTPGWIEIHPPWWASETLTVQVDGETEIIPCPMVGNGYNYEAVEVGDCIRNGRLESDVMPLDETLAILHVMDEVRAQIGLRYPMEL